MAKIIVKEYKSVSDQEYNNAAIMQKRNAGRKFIFRYYLDAMIVIDGRLYWIDQSECKR